MSRQALADATAGVIGSLSAMIIFYPLDTIKTNIQAAASKSNTNDKEHKISAVQMLIRILTGHSSGLQSSTREDPQSTRAQISRIKSLFRGIPIKALHTVTSSFTYFYLYSLLQSWHARHRYYGRDYKPSTGERMIIAAIAAMMNVSVTLPLDVISARRQTETMQEDAAEEYDEGDSPTTLTLTGGSGRYPPIRKEISFQSEVSNDDDSIQLSPPPVANSYADLTILWKDRSGNDERLNGPNDAAFSNSTSFYNKIAELSSYWAGIGPSLLLCSNPAIHFTIFDVLKAFLMTRKVSHVQSNAPSSEGRLSMSEAFVVGLIAKSFATIMTYPLIRTKVLLMVNKSSKINDNATKSNNYYGDTMVDVLCRIFKEEGMAGLFKGCDLQLIQSVLKSALLMMVRERITVTTNQLLLGRRK